MIVVVDKIREVRQCDRDSDRIQSILSVLYIIKLSIIFTS